jgi:hypothetical protein
MSTRCFGPFDAYVLFTCTSRRVLRYFSRVHALFLEAAGGVVGIGKASKLRPPYVLMFLKKIQIPNFENNVKPPIRNK